jgi:hypothetical protein
MSSLGYLNRHTNWGRAGFTYSIIMQKSITMKLNTFLILNAIVWLFNAVGALLIPARVLSVYGVSPGAGTELMAQYAAIGSVVIAILAFYAGKTRNSEAKKVIVFALFISGAIGVIVSFSGTVNNTMNSSGWLLAGTYLFFTAGYAYFLFIKKSTWKISEKIRFSP